MNDRPCGADVTHRKTDTMCHVFYHRWVIKELYNEITLKYVKNYLVRRLAICKARAAL